VKERDSEIGPTASHSIDQYMELGKEHGIQTVKGFIYVSM